MSNAEPTRHSKTLPQDHVLLRASALPFGFPEFAAIQAEDFEPAFEIAMAEHLKEIAAIVHSAAGVTFENTMVALEKSGDKLARVAAIFGNLTASHTNAELDRVQTVMAPKLSAHNDAILLDGQLFDRIRFLYDARSSLNLDAESQRLLDRYYQRFVRAGAKLSDHDKTRLKTLNEQLASWATSFRQMILKGTNANGIVVDSVEELAGLSDGEIAAAAEAARTQGLEGKWLIALLNTTSQPALASLQNRGLRRRLYEASISRGLSGPHATTELVVKLAKLRAERAQLLGFEHHASYVLANETAQSVETVNSMLAQFVPTSVANAKREASEIQKLIDSEASLARGESFRLEPWDWSFYAERMRKLKYDFDEKEVRPYFEFNRVLRDGVFFAAHELYGVSFAERTDLTAYEATVRVFEMFDRDGSSLGLFLCDWFARSNKRGGAWMSSFMDQSHLLGRRAIIINNLNIAKPPAGQPTLLTFEEVTTAFHEFGHALHGFFSDVRYPLLSGTNVPRDFVEFPSQYNEMWSTDPRVLANYAKHFESGESMPRALMDKVLAAQKFNQGYATTEYLAAAVLDQAWHQLSPDQVPDAQRVEEFEARALSRAGVDFYAVPPRYRSTYFSHIFASASGYAAGYYAYIWSEVLARDTEQWFKARGGLSRSGGDELRNKILSKGFSADPITLFEDFYGGPPDIGPLLQKRGLINSQ